MVHATGRKAKIAGSLSAAALLTSALPAHAGGLNINKMPASAAIGRVDQAFDTDIGIDLGVNRNRQVSFNIPDTSAAGGRLSAVSYLAHQLNATPQALLIVNKSNGTAWKAPSALDTTANVTFTSRTMPAEAVLRQIAYVDNASLRFNVPVTGNVTLSDTVLQATQAAYEVAMQTHITLTPAYQLLSRTRPATMASTSSTIIGFTPGGQPITSDPTFMPGTPGLATSTRYAHRTTRKSTRSTRRYAHRTSPSTKSNTITIIGSGGSTTTGTTGAAPITGTPPATLLQPPPPGPSFYTLPGNGVLGAPYWTNPYPYAAPGWYGPYSIGNGVVILPSAPSGPTVIVP